MAGMIESLAAAIDPSFIPTDQSWLRESIVVGRTPLTMECEIHPDKGQSHLLCQFDRGGENNKLFPYFNFDVDGLVSMCDYVLFVEEPSRLLVLLLELKHNASPVRQLNISKPFGEFICERLKALSIDFNKPCIYRKIGIRQSYNPKHATKDYHFEFDKDDYALLPNPYELLLRMISIVIP